VMVGKSRHNPLPQILHALDDSRKPKCAAVRNIPL
jgi:hypothetical protein